MVDNNFTVKPALNSPTIPPKTLPGGVPYARVSRDDVEMIKKTKAVTKTTLFFSSDLPNIILIPVMISVNGKRYAA